MPESIFQTCEMVKYLLLKKRKNVNKLLKIEIQTKNLFIQIRKVYFSNLNELVFLKNL